MRQAVMKALNTWPEPGVGSHGSRAALPPGAGAKYYRPATREELLPPTEAELTSFSSRDSSRTLFGNHQQAPSLARKAPPHESYHRDVNMEQRRSPRRSEPTRVTVIPRRIGAPVGSEGVVTLQGHHVSSHPAGWPSSRASEDPAPSSQRESQHHQRSSGNDSEPRQLPEQQQQAAQQQGSSVADYKGVMLSSDKKSFVSFVACMGSVHFVGHFGSAFEAAVAHDNAVLRLLGPEGAAFTNYYDRGGPQGPSNPLATPLAAIVERRDSNSVEEQQKAAKARFLEDLFASRTANFPLQRQSPRSTSSDVNRDAHTSSDLHQAMHASAFEQALMLHSARSSSGRQSKTSAPGRDPSGHQPPICAPTALPFCKRETFDGRQRHYRSSSTNNAFHSGNADAPADRPKESDSKKRSLEPSTKASPSGDQPKPTPKKRGRPKLEDSQNGGVKSSRFRGVSWNKKDDKWQAMIFAKGKARWIGYFKQEEDAARAYDKEALAERGPRALLNFPPQAEYAAKEATSN